MRALALVLALGAAMVLSSCSVDSVQSSDEMVAKSVYRHAGPTRLTLFTMISNSSGSGRHSALMVNGSQRVIFDPAGTFKHEKVAEQNDVIYGITPQIEDGYTRYHARETFHVLVQRIDVSPAVAEMALREIRAYGAVPAGKCALATSTVLSRVPGFTHIQTGWWPSKLSDQFAKIPGVTSQELYEYDSHDNSKVLREWDPTAVSQ